MKTWRKKTIMKRKENSMESIMRKNNNIEGKAEGEVKGNEETGY